MLWQSLFGGTPGAYDGGVARHAPDGVTGVAPPDFRVVAGVPTPPAATVGTFFPEPRITTKIRNNVNAVNMARARSRRRRASGDWGRLSMAATA
jgi:hypothetical protein